MKLRYTTAEQSLSHQNQLLAVLSEEIKDQLAPHLELVRLPPGEVVYEAGYADRYAYFPNDAIVSLLSVIESGKGAEISVVGNEGIVGIDALVGGSNPCSQAVVQSAGTAYRMPAQTLKDQFNRHVELRWLVLRYMQSLITQMSQTAVCNRHHAIEQQVCRRLLLSLDRISGDEMPLTQEKIAYLLGVRREGVTRAARTLRNLGVIESRRGHIKVLDRAKLEDLSCECYAVVKAESDFLLPYSCLMHQHDGGARAPARHGASRLRPDSSLRSAAQPVQA
jgi:CRP-like cAMP-binding protein